MSKVKQNKHAAPKKSKPLPDLTEFRKSIRIKGEPLSHIVNKGRG